MILIRMSEKKGVKKWKTTFGPSEFLDKEIIKDIKHIFPVFLCLFPKITVKHHFLIGAANTNQAAIPVSNRVELNAMFH